MLLADLLEDTASRLRVAQSGVGLAGCLCVCYAVWTPCWLPDGGLWTERNATEGSAARGNPEGSLFRAQEAQQAFGVLSSLMAVCCAALCLVFALCWTSTTVHSYSNTRSLLMAGQTLYPTTLLLLCLTTTGFFFLLCWSLFTGQHQAEIHRDPSILGSSYWLGVLGWVLLLVVEPVVFLVEQCVVPDPLLELVGSVLYREGAPLRPRPSRCHSSPPVSAAAAATATEERSHAQARRVVSLV